MALSHSVSLSPSISLSPSPNQSLYLFQTKIRVDPSTKQLSFWCQPEKNFPKKREFDSKFELNTPFQNTPFPSYFFCNSRSKVYPHFLNSSKISSFKCLLKNCTPIFYNFGQKRQIFFGSTKVKWVRGISIRSQKTNFLAGKCLVGKKSAGILSEGRFLAGKSLKGKFLEGDSFLKIQKEGHFFFVKCEKNDCLALDPNLKGKLEVENLVKEENHLFDSLENEQKKGCKAKQEEKQKNDKLCEEIDNLTEQKYNLNGSLLGLSSSQKDPIPESKKRRESGIEDSQNQRNNDNNINNNNGNNNENNGQNNSNSNSTFSLFGEGDNSHMASVQVERDKWISCSKTELTRVMRGSFRSVAATEEFLSVCSYLDSILHAEHKAILEDLRYDYALTQTVLSDGTVAGNQLNTMAALATLSANIQKVTRGILTGSVSSTEPGQTEVGSKKIKKRVPQLDLRGMVRFFRKKGRGSSETIGVYSSGEVLDSRKSVWNGKLEKLHGLSEEEREREREEGESSVLEFEGRRLEGEIPQNQETQEEARSFENLQKQETHMKDEMMCTDEKEPEMYKKMEKVEENTATEGREEGLEEERQGGEVGEGTRTLEKFAHEMEEVLGDVVTISEEVIEGIFNSGDRQKVAVSLVEGQGLGSDCEAMAVCSSDGHVAAGESFGDEFVEEDTMLRLLEEVDERAQEMAAHHVRRVEEATVRFERKFLQLLHAAQFQELSVRDLELTAALNSDYLLTLPVDVDWKRASSANAVIFRRGYGVERETGLMLGDKLDFLQSALLRGLFSILAAPLQQSARWALKKWRHFAEGRPWLEKLSLWLLEPLLPGEDLQSEPLSGWASRTKTGLVGKGKNEEKKRFDFWDNARQPVPRYEAVLSKTGSRGALFCRLLRAAGLLNSGNGGNPLIPKWEEESSLEPHLRSRQVARVAMRDIWQPAMAGPRDVTAWRRFRAAFGVFFSRVELQEPAFKELVVLYSKLETGPVEGDTEGRLQLQAYKNIPIPDLKVVFPDKKLSYRLLDTVRLDLTTIVGLVAFGVNYRFDDLLSSPSAFILDLIATFSLVVFVTKAVLGYKRTWDRYELLVNRTLYQKTLASGFRTVQFLVDSSEEQQFKEAALAYAVLLQSNQPMRVEDLRDSCERLLFSRLSLQVKMPIQSALKILSRFGLVNFSDSKEKDESRCQSTEGGSVSISSDGWRGGGGRGGEGGGGGGLRESDIACELAIESALPKMAYGEIGLSGPNLGKGDVLVRSALMGISSTSPSTPTHTFTSIPTPTHTSTSPSTSTPSSISISTSTPISPSTSTPTLSPMKATSTNKTECGSGQRERSIEGGERGEGGGKNGRDRKLLEGQEGEWISVVGPLEAKRRLKKRWEELLDSVPPWTNG